MICYPHGGLDSDIICAAGWLLSRIQLDVIKIYVINTEERFFGDIIETFYKSKQNVYFFYFITRLLLGFLINFVKYFLKILRFDGITIIFLF